MRTIRSATHVENRPCLGHRGANAHLLSLARPLSKFGTNSSPIEDTRQAVCRVSSFKSMKADSRHQLLRAVDTLEKSLKELREQFNKPETPPAGK